jgi:hypothetical protein
LARSGIFDDRLLAQAVFLRMHCEPHFKFGVVAFDFFKSPPSLFRKDFDIKAILEYPDVLVYVMDVSHEMAYFFSEFSIYPQNVQEGHPEDDNGGD